MTARKHSLLFDLQSLQNGSSKRGIGRYAREHFNGLLGIGQDAFDMHCMLDLTYEAQAGDVLGEYAGRLAADRIHGYRYPTGMWSAYPTAEPEAAFSEELVRLHVEAMAPDVVHVPSLFEGAVEACAGLGRVARARGSISSCLVHDLIPLVMEEHYLADPRARAWYQHKTAQLREFDVLLANSQTTKDDVVRLLDCDPQRVHVIYAGYAEIFRQKVDKAAAARRLENRFRLASPFVLYTGNNDPRKNTRGAIAGFASLPPAVRSDLKLVLNQAEHADDLRQFARQCGLDADALVMTGYVTDAELADLYACCRAFVFPSLYEGFGLPVVEAMSCGAPVLVGDNSSLREIMELDEARFDASDHRAIGAALERVLQDEGWSERLRRYGEKRINAFSWTRTAQLSIDAWQVALECSRARDGQAAAGSGVAVVVPEALPEVQQTEWADALSGYVDSGSVEIACPVPERWPSYLQVQPFPQHALASDAGIDLLIALHSDAQGRVLRGLAFLGEREAQMRAQWPGLCELLSSGQIPPQDHALPELISHCRGILEAGPHDGLLAATVGPMLQGSPVHAEHERGDAKIALGWMEATRQRFAHLSAEAVASLLDSVLPNQVRTNPQPVREALCSAGQFGMPRRVLIDMSELARVDYGTGIQRVVRNLVRELCSHNAEGRLLFVPVYHEGDRIRSAHGLVRKMLGIDCPAFDESEGFRTRDMLFLADSAWVGPERFLPSIGQVRRNGGEVAVFFHDIIPLRFPQTCGEGMPAAFRAWTEFAVRYADVYVCNSLATAQDLQAWIAENRPEHRPRYRVGHVHLGSDVMELGTGADIRASMRSLFAEGERTFLAVGTIEPRKDYRTILDAFELAWDSGLRANLLIVGKNGWGSDALVGSMRASPHFGSRLFWPENVSNAELDLAYRSTCGLIQASISEGFGLPIVEAARYGAPLLLSDIPVFREVAGEHASYFPVGDSAALAKLLLSGGFARSDALAERVLTWRDYGRELRTLLLKG